MSWTVEALLLQNTTTFSFGGSWMSSCSQRLHLWDDLVVQMQLAGHQWIPVFWSPRSA